MNYTSPDDVISNRKPPGRAGRARVYAIDLDAARRYLAGVESMAGEAARSSDPRVIVLALNVLLLQPKNLRWLQHRVRLPRAA